jgi:hypothetical protein
LATRITIRTRCRLSVSGRIAPGTPTPPNAALAHALGEIALLDGAADQAVTEFNRSLRVLSELRLPYQHACTQLRAAAAFTAAGHTESAVERLRDAYASARKLGAQPLATSVASALEQLGARGE